MPLFTLKNFCMWFFFSVIGLINGGQIRCWYKFCTSCEFCWNLEAFSQCSTWLFHFVECDVSVSVDINYLFPMEDCCFSSCKIMLVRKLLRCLIGEWSLKLLHFVVWINVACVVHSGWFVKQQSKVYMYMWFLIFCVLIHTECKLQSLIKVTKLYPES